MIKKPKSAIYWNMRRQGASGQDVCRKVMQSGGPDKAKRFREASVSTRKKHYRELQWHANDEESVGKNVENREYKHLKRQYKKD